MATVKSLNEARKERLAKPGKGKAKDSSVADRIAEINREFALVVVGDKTMVLRETEDFLGKPVIVYLAVNAFLTLYENERVWDDEAECFTGLGHLWKKHPDRRTYHGIAFAPEGVDDKKKWFNMWQGFVVQPAAPYDDPRDHARKHFPTLWDHVLRNIAQGNADLARWVWAWFADWIQNPTVKRGVALALRGKQGTGKSILFEAVGSLLGPHCVKISQPKHLTGAFNAHMAACLLLVCEEGFWAGDKAAEGVLKDLITSDAHILEKKGNDGVAVRNLIRLGITSNNSWVTPAGFEERRFAVLDVGEGNMQDRVFFGKIHRELSDGGREHLLAYLQRFDLSQVDLNRIPQTEALWEQKVASMSELQQWWWERLQAGTLLPSDRKWTDEVPVDRLYDNFWRYHDRISKSRKPPKSQWAIELRKLLPHRPGGGAPFRDQQKVWVQDYEDGVPKRDMNGDPVMKRVNGWKDFPDLGECREYFEKTVGRTFRWADEGESEATSPAKATSSVGDGMPVARDGGVVVTAPATDGDPFDLSTGW